MEDSGLAKGKENAGMTTEVTVHTVATKVREKQ